MLFFCEAEYIQNSNCEHYVNDKVDSLCLQHNIVADFKNAACVPFENWRCHNSEVKSFMFLSYLFLPFPFLSFKTTNYRSICFDHLVIYVYVMGCPRGRASGRYDCSVNPFKGVNRFTRFSQL